MFQSFVIGLLHNSQPVNTHLLLSVSDLVNGNAVIHTLFQLIYNNWAN